jgi:hypothetical protein
MKQTVEANPTQLPLGTHPFHFQRPWKLVRADKNIAQDVLHQGPGTVLDLRVDKGTGVVTAFGNAPPAFVDCQLELKGSVQPELEAAGLRGAFNPYDVERDDEYKNALDDQLIPYLKRDMDLGERSVLAHLEGVITMRCCWPVAGSRLAELNPEPHFVKTDIRLYLFNEGVKDGMDQTSSRSSLLVLWAPDSPRLPINPDGTILGTP